MESAQSNPGDSVGINDVTLQDNIIYGWTVGVDFEGGLNPGGKGLTALNRVSVINNQFENVTVASVLNHDTSYLAQEKWTGNTYYKAGALAHSRPPRRHSGNPTVQGHEFPQPARHRRILQRLPRRRRNARRVHGRLACNPSRTGIMRTKPLRCSPI